MNDSTCTEPYSDTRPRSLRPRSTSITCSARSFSSASSDSAIALVLVDRRAARPRAGDRARRDAAAVDGQQRLGRGADDLEVLEVEEVHVRRRVDRPQAAVDRERLDRRGRRPALRRDDLEGVAGVHVLDDAGDHRLERLARHVGLELRLGTRAAAAGRGSGPASSSRTSWIASRARSWRFRVLVDVGVGEDRDRVPEVVEGDDHVGEHQRHVGQADRVRVRAGQPLDGAHAVVAEEADRAAGERDRLVGRRLPEAPDLVRGERVRVAAVGQRPAHDLARLVADERPAADALALLGRLEQERRSGAAELEEGGDRRLGVLDEASRRRGRGCGRRSQRRRAPSTSAASARLSPRERSSTARW